MDSTLTCLAGWMAQQRWYASKLSEPRLRLLTRLPVATNELGADAEILIVADESASPAVTYQVPIVTRWRAGDIDHRHVIHTTDDGRILIDGPHDRAFTTALFERVTSTSPGGGGATWTPTASAAPSPPAPPVEASVLSGEQSNTSIIFRPPTGGPVICKVFRQLHAGLNPDIELQSALARAGSPHVARSIGHLEATWQSAPPGSAAVTGSLAYAQEFLPEVEDAWRVARTAARAGESFAAAAHALGAATADVHESLAALFPTMPSDGPARSRVVGAWERRLAIATAEVPGIAEHRDAIAEVYALALGTVWPALQRIHGDYHLGQVLHAPGRGWVLVDFEGEPMRPMDERRRQDSSLRDVAGMLRSFDYVAASLDQECPREQLAEWARTARRSFLGGYEHRMGEPATGPLLDAFELDKAVYEAIYEARNRPAWLPIPLGAIARLVTTTQPGRIRTQ